MLLWEVEDGELVLLGETGHCIRMTNCSNQRQRYGVVEHCGCCCSFAVDEKKGEFLHHQLASGLAESDMESEQLFANLKEQLMLLTQKCSHLHPTHLKRMISFVTHFDSHTHDCILENNIKY